MTEVVRRAQDGDEAAFEGIYRECAGRVYALCLRLTGNAAEAEERTQDVFVRAWQRLGTFRGESAFTSWLHRLAVNVVLAERRATQRREQRVQPVEDPGALERPGRSAAGWEGGGWGEQIDLERAVAALPEGAREVFVLHDIEGYRHDEIAAQAGIAAGTSKAQLFRARRLLREMLER